LVSNNAITSLCASIKSSLLVREKIGGSHNSFFEIPAKRKGRKPILFGRIEIETIACESSRGNSESPQNFNYGQKSSHMMERIGYDFNKELGLNFGKEKMSTTSFICTEKVKTLITTTRPEGDSVMYLHQSHQILNQKRRSVMTSLQQHCRRIYTSASAISS